MDILLSITQTPASGKAPFRVTVIPSIMIGPGTFRYARWLTAPLFNAAVGVPGTEAACQGPNLNT
ncbi:MAG: hypothetical protein ACXVDN_16710 [Ktedonobacteraceae bacterium]